MTFFRFRARHGAAWRFGHPLSATTTHLAYRPDIDGLRALAVLFVVAFHAFPDALSGGFIGVDVFFVISGYLITGILFKTLDDGTFSFANFYYRRIVRLFPALAIVLAFCAVSQSNGFGRDNIRDARRIVRPQPHRGVLRSRFRLLFAGHPLLGAHDRRGRYLRAAQQALSEFHLRRR
jgi:hypothetical protein